MDEFVLAAKRVHSAAADGMDMKLCHGYLGSQILRPCNNRKWKYGGTWENRSRFAFEPAERISKESNDEDFIIGPTVCTWEGFPGGFGTDVPDSPKLDLGESKALPEGHEERGTSYFIQSAASSSTRISLTQADRHPPDFAKELKSFLRPETVLIGSNSSEFKDGGNGFCAMSPQNSNLLSFSA